MDGRHTDQRIALDALDHLVLGHVGVGDACDLLPIAPEPVGDRRRAELLETFDERVGLARTGACIENETPALGKALGGASGGYTSGKKEIIDLLRQRSRPYLFSNTIAPPIVAASLKVFEMLEASTELADRVKANTQYFRDAMAGTGFTIAGKDHPISPVMLGDAALSQQFADKLLEKGVYAIGFFFPVVPQGKARIRTQISAAHTREQLDQGIEAFIAVGKELGVI